MRKIVFPTGDKIQVTTPTGDLGPILALMMTERWATHSLCVDKMRKNVDEKEKAVQSHTTEEEEV